MAFRGQGQGQVPGGGHQPRGGCLPLCCAGALSLSDWGFVPIFLFERALFSLRVPKLESNQFEEFPNVSGTPQTSFKLVSETKRVSNSLEGVRSVPREPKLESKN